MHREYPTSITMSVPIRPSPIIPNSIWFSSLFDYDAETSGPIRFPPQRAILPETRFAKRKHSHLTLPYAGA